MTPKESISKYKQIKSQLEALALGQPMLNVGDIVILKNGKEQVITKRNFDEVQGDNAFFRWNAFFPFQIEHAAMEEGMQIVDIKRK
jgi:hypothetical protein